MDKTIANKSQSKSRLIMYCIECSLSVVGVVMLVLSVLQIGFENLPIGSRISGATMLIVLPFAPLLIEKIFRYHFPIMLHIIYFVYIAASIMIGSCFGVFRMDVPIMGDMIGWYDKITHAVLGYILCVVAVYMSQKVGLWGKTKSGDVLLIIAISMAFASIWEIFEFAVDHIIPGQSMQRNSLIDTMLDMVAHFALTIVFVIQYLIEKCCKVNLGIAFMESNLLTGGKLPKAVKGDSANSDENTQPDDCENVESAENVTISNNDENAD